MAVRKPSVTDLSLFSILIASCCVWLNRYQGAVLASSDSFWVSSHGFVILVNAVVAGVFAFQSTLFYVVDVYNFPRFMHKYRMQPQQKPSGAKIRSMFPLLALNLLVVDIIFSYGAWESLKMRGPRLWNTPVPSVLEFFLHFMAFIIVEEIGFTIAHRLFHTRLLYRFHKIHHSFTSPVAATALYAHPLEHVFANVGPVFLGPCLMNSHITVMLMWVSLAIISTTLKHSGYYIPFNQSPGFHDAHHEYVWNGNYGMFQVADWIMGWDKVYRSKVKAKSGNLLNVPKVTKAC